MKKMLELLQQQGIVLHYYKTGKGRISIELFTGEIVDVKIGDQIEIRRPQESKEIMYSYSDMMTYFEGCQKNLKTFNF